MAGSSSVEWRKNGKSLKDHPKLFRKSSWKTEDGDTRTRLQIVAGNQSRDGVYTCVGRDEYGAEIASSSTHVFFNEGSCST